MSNWLPNAICGLCFKLILAPMSFWERKFKEIMLESGRRLPLKKRKLILGSKLRIDFPNGFRSFFRGRYPGSERVAPKQNMSVGHSEASFNHSCLKVPVDSLSRRPSPKYERLSSGKKSKVRSRQEGREDDDEEEDKKYPLSNLYNNFKSVKSYLAFYESIPDYRELHHLSNEEFYSRLQSLKITQKRFCSESNVLDTADVDEPFTSSKPFRYPSASGSQGNSEKTEGCKTSAKPKICVCCSFRSTDYCNGLTDVYDKKVEEGRTVTGIKQPPPPKINIISDNENGSDPFESELKKHSGYEADRESSNLQVGDKFSMKPKSYSSSPGDEYLLSNPDSRSRAFPMSPGCECVTPEFCNRYSDSGFGCEGCHSRLGSGICDSEKDKRSLVKKPKKTHPRPVPLTSRIPLYDKIMMEKEARRRIMHDQYSEELRSLVKPFSFTKREEERERLRMICSNPELTSLNQPVVRFKARPIPKNLFSNYAYERMKEDEFYRALKKRIRAEEMLKASSLPPSMALREKKFRSKSLDFLDYRSPKKTWNKACGYRRACKNLRKEIEFDEKNKTGSHQRRRLQSSWISNGKRINSATNSSTEISPYESVLEPEERNRRKGRPHSAFSTTRNNLASVLRIQTARKRLEREMEEKLKENRLKDEARFKARLVRMTPAWRALSFDRDEDIALRVAARREEERLKKEKHHELMESMYGRVYRMPPLFHEERFQSGKSSKLKNSSKDSINDLLNNDHLENQKTGDGPVETENNSKSSSLPNQEEKLSESSCDKSERGKTYESDDTMWQNEF